MTVTDQPHDGGSAVSSARDAAPAVDLVNLTIDGMRCRVPKGTLVIRAAEEVGIADPAVLRPPAARAGRRLPPVPRRRRDARAPTAQLRPMPKPQASCTITVSRGHGGQDAADLAGRRQGAAGRHGAAAHQPPARLPGLRQGRRVPPAEPGDEQRPRPSPASRTSSAPTPSRSTSPPRCCSTASAACCAPAAPASPSRSPVTRSSRWSSGAPCSRSASTRSSRSSPTSPATPSRSARWAR